MVGIEVGVENECITTSYYDFGGTEKQKIVTPALHDRLDGGNDGDRVQSHERP
jgi:hypothetical protein